MDRFKLQSDSTSCPDGAAAGGGGGVSGTRMFDNSVTGGGLLLLRVPGREGDRDVLDAEGLITRLGESVTTRVGVGIRSCCML